MGFDFGSFATGFLIAVLATGGTAYLVARNNRKHIAAALDMTPDQLKQKVKDYMRKKFGR